jgi:uncharacterized protein involved in type VI secretion and phage assembly
MADSDFANAVATIDSGHESGGFAIAPGVVVNNLDLIGEGRVKVRVPSMPGFDLWARLTAIGASDSRGFLWVPSIDDEVLVAFAKDDERSAFVLGGLWSTMNRPPVATGAEAIVKRTLKTGQTSSIGHEIELDDALQSITITSSTSQTITIDPLKIEIKNSAGTLTISLDNTTQTIAIEAAAKLQLKAPLISIEGQKVDVNGSLVSVQSKGPCTVQGTPIKLN